MKKLLALLTILALLVPTTIHASEPIGDWIWVITQPAQPEVPETPAVPPTYEAVDGAWWYASTTCPEMFPTLEDWEIAILDPTWACNIFDYPNTSWTPVYVAGETIQTHPGYPAIPGTPALPEQGHWYNTVTGEISYTDPNDDEDSDDTDVTDPNDDEDNDDTDVTDPNDDEDNDDTDVADPNDDEDNDDTDVADSTTKDPQPETENNNQTTPPSLPQTGATVVSTALTGIVLAGSGVLTAKIKNNKK